MLRIAVLAITHRTLSNFVSVLHYFMNEGADCQVIWMPTSQALSEQGPATLGLQVAQDFSCVSRSRDKSPAVFRNECRHFLRQFTPNVVISDDMTTWPNRIIHEIIQELPDRPLHLAWQHGFFQPWYEMRERFDADFFLCYGRIHACMFAPAQMARVIPAGLPKLDALFNLETKNGGYLTWFAQPLPAPSKIIPMLAEISAATSRPIIVRPHPAQPAAFDSQSNLAERGLSVDDPAIDPLETLRSCDGFLSTHSSAAVEALLLEKTAVLFPSFGLTSFPGFPSVASDFTAKAYMVAAKRFTARRNAVDAFLADTIGGRVTNHTMQSVFIITALLSMHTGSGAIIPMDWWKSDNALSTLLTQSHPFMLQ